MYEKKDYILITTLWFAKSENYAAKWFKYIYSILISILHKNFFF